MRKFLEKNPWPTAAVLITAVLGLVAVWVFASEDERATMATGIGMIALPLLAVLRSVVPDKNDNDNVPPASGLAIVLAVAVASAFTSACGASAFQVHATIAAGLDTAADEAKTAIRTARVDAGLRAARDVHASGGDEAAALAASRAELARWEAAVEAHALFDRGIRTYVRAVLLEGVGLSVDRGLQLIAPVIELYQPLARLLDQLSGGSVTIALPPEAAQFLPLAGASDPTAGDPALTEAP